MIYERKCSCNLRYIGETKRNSEVRWKAHEDPARNLESAKNLIENASHKITWKVLSAALSHFRRRKILEVLFTALRKPALNNHLEHRSLSLFRHGIT